MADNKSITTPVVEKRPAVQEETRSDERFLRPVVDIIETEDGLMVSADMPGISRERLEVHIDKGILTIKGMADQVLRGNEIYREFDFPNYFRQFQLPDAIDQENVRADYAGGVLTLRLIKSERARPRRIEVRAG